MATGWLLGIFWGFSEDDSSPLEALVGEVDDEAYGELSDFEIREHLADFVIGDSGDGFCIDDNFLVNDQVGDVLADDVTFVSDVEWRLLKNGNFS